MTFSFWGRQKREEALEEELESHLRMAAKDRMDRGEHPEQARNAARREIGNVSLIKDVTREMWGWASLERLLQDLRYGLRMLVKSPGFAAVAILTLSLAIGANTALFSVVNAVLLNPLPYPHPEQLVALHESKPNFATGSISYPNFLDWQKNNSTFSSMAVARGYTFNLTGRGEAQQLRARFITSDLFSMLGVKPVMGRDFASGEDKIGAAPIAMISEGLWKREFASSPDAIGKSLSLDGRDYTLVGVIPASFDLSFGSFRNIDVFVPLGQWDNPLLPNRGAGLGVHGIGRLRPGVTIEQARADLDRVSGDLAAAYPDTNKGIGATIFPLKHEIVGQARPVLLVLLAAVGFVLLIACGNVANLLLARSTARTREFAIRAALGAGHGRLLRQLLTESTLLAMIGGALGLLLAGWGTQAGLRLLPAGLPRSSEVGLDGRVLFFTLAISLGCGVFFGLFPALRTALRTAQLSLHDTLKEGGRGGSGARHRTQGIFVATEMALALVLLISAGLMLRSLSALWSVNPGFDSHHVLTFSVALPPSMRTASPTAIRAGLHTIDREVKVVPGVKAVSLSWGAMPMSGDDEDLFWIEGDPRPATENEMKWSLSYVVEEDYLKVMGIPLERGRFFTPQDNENSPHVIVVDDVFARQYFGNQDPLGKRIFLDNKGGRAEIVGVVGHVKQWGLDSDDTESLRAQLYFPYMQLPDRAMMLSWNGTGMLVRYDPTSSGIGEFIRSAIKGISSEHVMSQAQTMDGIIAASLSERRFSMIVLGIFAAVALGLASVGIYGVISYIVGQRTHEIGVRIALGARPQDVLRLVLTSGMKMTLAGVLFGLLGAFGLTRLMAKLLFGVSATDPVTFAGVAVLLTIVALSACYIPARRAVHVDPLVALRYE